jgi:hypothetical protein
MPATAAATIYSSASRSRDEALSPHTARPKTAQKRYPTRTHRFGRQEQRQHAEEPPREVGYWSQPSLLRERSGHGLATGSDYPISLGND